MVLSLGCVHVPGADPLDSLRDASAEPSVDSAEAPSLPDTGAGTPDTPTPADTSTVADTGTVSADTGAAADTSAPGVQRSCPDPRERGCGLVALEGDTFVLGEATVALAAAPPQGPITVSGFSLDSHEVTVARFRRFWAAGHPLARSVAYRGGVVLSLAGSAVEPTAYNWCNWTPAPGPRETHPINCISWLTAQEFCAWDGGRLPTETELEYAARGRRVSGLPYPRAYPWGDEDPSPYCDRARWNGSGCVGDGAAWTRPVGSYSPTAGFYDLAGNVFEWAADSFVYYSSAMCWGGRGRTDPLCLDSSVSQRVTRGGSSHSSSLLHVRSASRQGADPVRLAYEVGLRCAR